MRFVGGPLHGQDITWPDGVPFLYEFDPDEATDLRSRVTYVVQAFGSGHREDGQTWRLDVMVAEGVRQSGQLTALLLDAFIADIPGARQVGGPRPAYEVGQHVWLTWEGHRYAAIVMARLAADVWHVGAYGQDSQWHATRAGARGGWAATPEMLEPRK